MAKFSIFAGLVVALAALDSVSAAIPAHLHPKRHLFERSAHAHHKHAARQSKYPEILKIPDPSLLPSAWKDALDAAVKSGKVPDLPPSTLDAAGNPSYPSKYSAKDIGSWTLSKYIDDTDISQAPDGVWAIGFDDGPTDESPPLYEYLQQQNQAATHFMIGSNIVSYPNEFMKANETGGQLAVHTWSHKLQTASTNEQVLGDLAWTMQIIYDRTGRIPNLWRPPQGDIDNRVRAIASEVLGLRCVLWQADSNDWCLDDNFKSECPADNTIGQSYRSVTKYVNQHLNGPTSPGLVILEHEIHKPSIKIFETYYPKLKAKGWTPKAIGEFDNQGGFYANAEDNTSEVTDQKDVLATDSLAPTSAAATSIGSKATGSASSGAAAASGSGVSTLSGGSKSASAASSQGTSNRSNSNSSTSGAMNLARPDLALAAGAAFVAAALL